MSNIRTIRFSPSQLFALTACGEAYRRKYILKHPEGTTPNLVRGSILHTAFEDALKEKLKTGGLPEEWLMVSRMREAIEDFRGKPIFYSPDLKEAGIDNEDAFLDLCHREAVAYIPHLANLASMVEPVEVETARAVQFTFNLDGENIAVVVEGRRDLKCRIPAWGITSTPAIADLKTSAKVKTQRDIDTSMQMTLYAVVDSILDRVPIESVPLAMLSCTPKGEGVVTSYRTQRDKDAFLQFVIRAAVVRVKEIFMPCDPSHWKCSPKYCAFHSTCHFIGEKVHAVRIESESEVEPSAAVQERDE